MTAVSDCECLEVLTYHAEWEWTTMKADTVKPCVISVSAPLGLRLYMETLIYVRSNVEDCRMTLVTAKTLNYDRNEIPDTLLIDYESSFDRTAYKQLHTNVQPFRAVVGVAKQREVATA